MLKINFLKKLTYIILIYLKTKTFLKKRIIKISYCLNYLKYVI